MSRMPNEAIAIFFVLFISETDIATNQPVLSAGEDDVQRRATGHVPLMAQTCRQLLTLTD
jgi:hypothetical protein